MGNSQKIVVKNFGPIEFAEIDLKKTIVIIGEQASGKSTIAKIIYFYKSLRDDLFSQVFSKSTPDSKDYDIRTAFVFEARDKFKELFGSTSFSKDTEITFYFQEKPIANHLRFFTQKNNKIECEPSPNFFTTQFEDEINIVFESLKSIRNETSFWKKLFSSESSLNQKLLSLVNDALGIYHTDSLFVIAGRYASVSYPEFFERLYSSIESKIGEQQTKNNASFDEVLMLRFMDWVIETKNKIKEESIIYNSVFKGTTSKTLEKYEKHELNSIPHISIMTKMFPIMKGYYFIDGEQEKILLPNSDKAILLSHTSSGQQAVIRILQDAFSLIQDGGHKIVFRIIEEPEVHLFPTAQKKIIELLASMVNLNDRNQLVITTHSPYILMVFNNLLYAKQVFDVTGKIKTIPVESHISSEDFCAYKLKNTQNDKFILESIMDNGLIGSNLLDEASEDLGQDFDGLYEVYGDYLQSN